MFNKILRNYIMKCSTSAPSIGFGRVHTAAVSLALILLLAGCTASAGQQNDAEPNISKETVEERPSWAGMVDASTSDIDEAQEPPINIDAIQRKLDDHVQLARTGYYRPPPPPTRAPDCVDAEILFEELPDGTILERADFISKQYEPFYGLTLSSSGPGAVGKHPRLFDTAKPGEDDETPDCGDKDLGNCHDRSCVNRWAAWTKLTCSSRFLRSTKSQVSRWRTGCRIWRRPWSIPELQASWKCFDYPGEESVPRHSRR